MLHPLSQSSLTQIGVNARYGGEDALSTLCVTGPFLRCRICILNQSLIGKAAAADEDQGYYCQKIVSSLNSCIWSYSGMNTISEALGFGFGVVQAWVGHNVTPVKCKYDTSD